MIVYRVEDSSGFGPYNRAVAEAGQETERAEFLTELYDRHSSGDDIENHPSWRRDGILDYRSFTDRAGFSSIKSIFRWFNREERRELKKYGFVIKKYKIPSEFVLRGDSKKQVAFNKSLAIEVGEIEY